ncbi:tRNA (guanine-N(7)-)-methyltransferase [Plasmodiophora brassicae]|uniref:tRNA (guanine-N(7)-)-methyltransferase n=1 Tax=Plasmodiophora brassicae TaxID=37360 RepID=A0A0G4IHI0_PLABS|nr:hypothetical protein PBRA_000466 [Plasmodiophora brassicae]
MPRQFQMSLPFQRVQGKRFVRIRAHVNPLSFSDQYVCPDGPSSVVWKEYFPKFPGVSDDAPAGLDDTVRFVDAGCGFGGLLEALAPTFPNKMILGMEIREQVVKHVNTRLNCLQAGSKGASEWKSEDIPAYSNIGVCHTNVMKYMVKFFQKGQLEKLFFLFPDPHFKRSNHRRRIISPNLLSEYAYVLQVGGLIYNVTDVEDLFNWTVTHFEAHPLFERLSEVEVAADPAVPAMFQTDEARRVKKNNGTTFVSVWRRIQD